MSKEDTLMMAENCLRDKLELVVDAKFADPTLLSSKEVLTRQIKKELSVIKRINLEFNTLGISQDDIERFVSGMKVVVIPEEQWKRMSKSCLAMSKIGEIIEGIQKED